MLHNYLSLIAAVFAVLAVGQQQQQQSKEELEPAGPPKVADQPPWAGAPVQLETATIYYQTASPTSAPSVLAVLEYDPWNSHRNPPKLTTFTPPTVDTSKPQKPIRVGLLETDSGLFSSAKLQRRTTTTSPLAFVKPEDGVLRLSLSMMGDAITSASFSMEPVSPLPRERAVKDKKGEPRVEIIRLTPAPQPFLNKPVVVSPEGKVKEEVPEKTLLQKYWWLGVAVLFLAMMGGGEK